MLHVHAEPDKFYEDIYKNKWLAAPAVCTAPRKRQC